jgi:hypothetical protein
MVKRTNAADDWMILDAARQPANTGSDPYLYADNPQAENSVGPLADILSNGFKVRGGTTSVDNISGGTYVYAAFAEQPFGGSNVAPATAR